MRSERGVMSGSIEVSFSLRLGSVSNLLASIFSLNDGEGREAFLAQIRGRK